MTSRILIADDSLTIQKVIGITLASSGYELIECLNEVDLLEKIKNEQFDLVLLDFNLSDSRSGYVLAKEISRAIPNAAIIAMLGTFDSIDESQFESCGITDKIVKPFESAKFIKKCHDLLEGNRPFLRDSKIVTSQIETPSFSEDDLDEWRVDAPHIEKNDFLNEAFDSLKSREITEEALDPLTSEIEGWGFSSNNSIEDKFQKIFPPVIEEESSLNTITNIQSTPDHVEISHLISSEKTNDLSFTDFLIPENINFNLFNETEQSVSSDTFWAVDEVIDNDSDKDEYVEERIESKEEEKFIAKPKAKIKEKNISIIDQDDIIEKLKLAMHPIIEEMVKKYCLQSAEKVAWEIIPDLAENLIRKEIKDISDSVQS